MQIKLPQLNATLKKSIEPLYLITGDEPLLQQEAQQQIRQACQAQGFLHRELLSIEPGTSWDDLYSHTTALDLFSEKKILDIRHPQTKFDKKAQQFLLHLSENRHTDTVVMISSGKLSAAQKKAKWFKQLEKNASIITIWPVSNRDLPQWIQQRLAKANIKANHASIQLLASLTEGNLLATQQAITKLKLLYPSTTVQPQHICHAIHDTARFTVFDLSNYALAGNLVKTQRALQQLLSSGTEPTLILWALTREVRLLHKLLHAKNQGENIQNLLRFEWQSRQQLLKSAAARLPLPLCEQLLQLAAKTDKCIKGLTRDDIPTRLSQIAAGLCGTVPLPCKAIS